MKIVKKISVLRLLLETSKKRGRGIGFVPTMGFLHEGHLSLVRRAQKENDLVVVSIFVNPLQFGPREDLKKYPRDLKKDIRLLGKVCDILFVPEVHEMYKKDFCTRVDVGALGDLLCGRARPGHFAGVTTVVAKLFNIVKPCNAYFGQKDAQQAAIIKKMVHDLNYDINVIVMPTVREKDGLAMSSRNSYLTPGERKDAVVLFQALKSGQRLLDSGVRESEKIIAALKDFIGRVESARLEYIELVDPLTFKPIVSVEGQALLLLSVHIGKTRLIDNMLLKAKNSK